MKTSFAYSGVAIVMFATGLSAQTQAPSNQGSSSAAALVTVGCVNRALPTGSLAPAPGVSSAPPTAAPMVAN
jgi:hypothetical protein